VQIYLAGHNQDEGRRIAYKLRRSGYSVISSWLTEKRFGREEYTERQCRSMAKRDVQEIGECDALILMAGPDLYPGGKFVEAGIAFGLGKSVIVLGRRENMLLWHPNIIAVQDVRALLDALPEKEE